MTSEMGFWLAGLSVAAHVVGLHDALNHRIKQGCALMASGAVAIGCIMRSNAIPILGAASSITTIWDGLCGSHSVKRSILEVSAGITTAAIITEETSKAITAIGRVALPAIAPLGLAYNGIREIANKNYLLGMGEIVLGLLAMKEAYSCI